VTDLPICLRRGVHRHRATARARHESRRGVGRRQRQGTGGLSGDARQGVQRARDVRHTICQCQARQSPPPPCLGFIRAGLSPVDV
jgi:hypothetical protein